jgi:cell division protease FtsH
MSLPERDDYNMRREKLKGIIAMCYGGRAAEEIVFGDVSVGAQNDIEKATNFARMMVCEFGMSDAVGPIRYAVEQYNEFLGRDFRLAGDIAPGTLELIDREVRGILDQAYERARRLMIEHRGELEIVAQGLLKYETLTGEEVSAIVRGDNLEEFRAARERAAQQSARSAPEPRPADERMPGRGELTGREGLAPS